MIFLGIVCQAQRRLPGSGTIFQAETQSLLSALSAALNLVSLGDSLLLFIDSRSSLQAIYSRGPVLSLAYELQKLAIVVGRNYNLPFLWVKGHAGIAGNVLADQWAQLALHDSNVPFVVTTIPWTAANRIFDSYFSSEWDAEYTAFAGPRTTEFSPTPNCGKILQEIKLTGCISQIFTGHCQLNYFLNKIGVAESPETDFPSPETGPTQFIHPTPKCLAFPPSPLH